jgi:hypothetical protein
MMKQMARERPDRRARRAPDACSLCGSHPLRWTIDAFGRAGDAYQLAMRSQADQGKLHVRLTRDLAALIDPYHL